MPNSFSQPKLYKILIICAGNTCRSPMAQAILRNLLTRAGVGDNFRVSSAGLSAMPGEPINPAAHAALKKLKIPVRAHKARRLDGKMLRGANLVLTMTQTQKLMLGKDNKIFSLAGLTDGKDVSDPFGQSEEVYVMTALELTKKLETVVNSVLLRR